MNHTYAQDDAQEAEMLRLAMALSAAEAQGPSAAAGQREQQRPAAPKPAQEAPPPTRPAGPAGAGGAGPPAGVSGVLRALGSGLRAAAAAGAGAVRSGSSALGLPVCGGCGGVIGASAFGETVLTALGKQWHPSCFVCAGCRRPIAGGPNGGGVSFVPGDDGASAYHRECHRELFHPRCCVCRGLIPQLPDGRIQWNMRPLWKDEAYCPSHETDGTPSCYACGRMEPRGEEWVVLADRQRRLCLRCLGTVVIDTKDAQPLYKEVLEFFRAQGMPHAYAPPLLMVESSVLEDHASRELGRRRDEDGPVFHVRGLCVATVYTSIPSIVRVGAGLLGVGSVDTRLPPGAQQHCTVQSLLVLYGLPRLLAGSIIAHELTHAWIRMQNVAGIEPTKQVEEGLCQLIAYLWLESQDYAAKREGPDAERLASYLAHQIRSDTSPVYGDGFRAALDLYQARGLRALFDYALRHRAWPTHWAGDA